MMKRFLIVLLLLCPIFRVIGQDKNIIEEGNIPSGDVTPPIGGQVPDVLISGVRGLRLDGKTIADGGAVRLSAFRGKLLILDFWATWCAPCRSMMPVMDSLQRVFGNNKVLFLSVTYQSLSQVSPVLSALQKVKPFNLPEVTGDVVLHRLFPHHTLPHYVWIGADGRLKAVTENNAVTGANIQKLLNDEPVMLAEKKDVEVSYDHSKLLFDSDGAAVAGGTDSLIRYRSVLSGYVPGLRGGMDIVLPDSLNGFRANVRNSPLTWLFRMAYSDHGRWFSGPRMRLLSRDSALMTTRLSGQAFLAWLKAGNGWSYELTVPRSLSAGAYTMMQEDVRRLFPQYRVGVEKVRTRCLVLVRTSGSDKLRSSGGERSVEVGAFSASLRNVPLSWWLKRMEVQFLGEGTLPLVDETGYSEPVDMKLNASMVDPRSLNTALAGYGLQFVEKDADTDLLVVRDNPIPKP
ncbi:redoxin domain-containing protein [Mucilaginibacter achroorhodeus]|uniref:Redoxin domain-containing protein n=1 Tax=Mucilaginibacter achroorhodeus TaxID=2599294 RepID=A0A563U642_9SPHI|nr:TlpA family protein disulfide reductase [Mucilaginibacter achroorhodeus]TWR26784.1 redoxin domain-containing protein [Mucilaginibacter achroorhodeus]